MKSGVPIFLAVLILCGGLAFGLMHHRRQKSGPVATSDSRFEFTVKAPYSKVAPLFGAWEEKAWAGADWNPHFLVPDPPEDRDGMVFTVRHGRATSVWVNTLFDLVSGRIQYVYTMPGIQVVIIDINLARKGEAETIAMVRYRRTALDAAQNEMILAHGRSDEANGPIWAEQIEAGLRGI